MKSSVGAMAVVLVFSITGFAGNGNSVSGEAADVSVARSSESSGEQRPNLVVLFLDDQAFFALGASGNDEIKTPHMDALAAEGVIFDRHYNSTAICMASRATLMTGRYEYEHGCNFGHGPMHPETFEQAYPVLMKNAGYRTAFGGKFGFPISEGASDAVQSWEVLPVEQFDSWAGGLGQTHYTTAKNRYLKGYADRFPHSSRAYGAFGQDFIAESAQGDAPFCLTLFFKAPHWPQTPDPFFDDVYDGVVFSKPVHHGRDAAAHLAPQSRMGRQYLELYERFGFDDAGYQTAMRNYCQQVFGVDYAIGMLREELERQGLDDDTVIVVTSDNGYFCGAHGFGGKVLPYEEGSRAPLIIFDPRLAADQRGRRHQGLTTTVDVTATILDFASIAIPDSLDGTTLKHAMANPDQRVRDSVRLFQVWGEPATHCMAIVSETHKYIYWPFADGIPASEELYDLANDPREMNNVIDSPGHAAELATLREAYSEALSDWQRDAVPYNDYRRFATVLDPSVPWIKKKSMVPTREKPSH